MIDNSLSGQPTFIAAGVKRGTKFVNDPNVWFEIRQMAGVEK